jgi:hypothetical protein
MQVRCQRIPKNRRALARVRIRQDMEKAREWLIKAGMTY